MFDPRITWMRVCLYKSFLWLGWWQLWPRGVLWWAVCLQNTQEFLHIGTKVQLDWRMNRLESGGQRSVWCPTTRLSASTHLNPVLLVLIAYWFPEAGLLLAFMSSTCVDVHWHSQVVSVVSPDVCSALMSYSSYKRAELLWLTAEVKVTCCGIISAQIPTLRFFVPWICWQWLAPRCQFAVLGWSLCAFGGINKFSGFKSFNKVSRMLCWKNMMDFIWLWLVTVAEWDYLMWDTAGTKQAFQLDVCSVEHVVNISGSVGPQNHFVWSGDGEFFRDALCCRFLYCCSLKLLVL